MLIIRSFKSTLTYETLVQTCGNSRLEVRCRLTAACRRCLTLVQLAKISLLTSLYFTGEHCGFRSISPWYYYSYMRTIDTTLFYLVLSASDFLVIFPDKGKIIKIVIPVKGKLIKIVIGKPMWIIIWFLELSYQNKAQFLIGVLRCSMDSTMTLKFPRKFLTLNRLYNI